jgi:hypothetical protein
MPAFAHLCRPLLLCLHPAPSTPYTLPPTPHSPPASVPILHYLSAQSARDQLLRTCLELQARGAPASPPLLASLHTLHVYTLVRQLVRQGDHAAAARLLLLVAQRISEFPKHAVPILTSTVVECHRAALHGPAQVGVCVWGGRDGAYVGSGRSEGHADIGATCGGPAASPTAASSLQRCSPAQTGGLSLRLLLCLCLPLIRSRCCECSAGRKRWWSSTQARCRPPTQRRLRPSPSSQPGG